MKNKNKFGFGGYVDPISEYFNIKRQRASNIPNQIESPDQAIADNNIRLSKAQQKAMSNPLTQGLDIFGNIAMQVGSSMMSKGISAGEGGDGKGIAGFLNNNQNFISTLLGGLNAGASFATGGVAGNKQINAEGGEVVEMPGSFPKELQGPSHSQGGINMTVPSGTEIYSDRLVGADGKTMAERKKLREKQISKIEKLLQKNPNDSALKKTLEKTKQNNDFLDKQDLSQMQFVKDLVDHTDKFWSGGYAGEESSLPTFDNKFKNLFGLVNGGLPTNVGTTYYPDPIVENMLKNQNAQDLKSNNINLGTTKPNSTDFKDSDGDGISDYIDADTKAGPEVYAPASTEPSGKYGNASQNKGFSLDNYLGGTTLGDMIGMGANLFGANAQMNNTLANRNATPLEQNWFKDYGKQALSKIQEQYGLLDDIRDNALSSLEKDRAGSISRNNASARSINTQRALNLATDAAINNNKSDLYSKFAQSMLGVKSQEAAQMDRNDQMRMTGEEKRAERELQNTDNFFSNMAKNISDKYRGIGETGKALNETKQRKAINEILKGMNPNYEYDPYTGKLITKKTETLETEKAKDADIRRQGAVKSTSSEDVYTKDGKVDPDKITDKMWKNRFSSKEEAIKFYTEHKDDIHRDKLIPKEIDTEYKRWKFSDGTKFNSKEEYDNAIKFGHKLELNTQITGSKHLTAKNTTDADNANLQSVMKKLNIDTLDFDNQDSIRALQKALGMKSSDIAAGKFGQKTLLAIKKYLEKNK